MAEQSVEVDQPATAAPEGKPEGKPEAAPSKAPRGLAGAYTPEPKEDVVLVGTEIKPPAPKEERPADAPRARPTDVPEKFWDAKAGKVNEVALLKAHADREAANAKLVKELEEVRGGEAPKSVKDYAVTLAPEDLGGHAAPADDDPILGVMREVALEWKVPAAKFQEGIRKVASKIYELAPPPVDVEAEKQKLGKGADQIIRGVVDWAEGLKRVGLLSEEEKERVLQWGFDAQGMRLLAKFRERMGEKSIPLGLPTVEEGTASAEEYYEAVKSADYRPGTAFYAKWRKIGERIFGTEPARSSPAGLGVNTGPRQKPGKAA